MRSPQYPEDVILCLLKEADMGEPIAQVCSTARVSTRTFYRWRARYGGLTPHAARERNDLVHENARLRALVHALQPEHLRGAETKPVDKGSFRLECGMHQGVLPNATPTGSSLGRFASVRGRR